MFARIAILPFLWSAMSMPLAAQDNCLEQLELDPLDLDHGVEVVAQGREPNASESKAIVDMIAFLEDVKECFPPADSTAMPPEPSFGGNPPNGPHDPSGQLSDKHTAKEICIDDSHFDDGEEGAVSNLPNTDPLYPHTMYTPDGIHYLWVKGDQGINIPETPKSLTESDLPDGYTFDDFSGHQPYGSAGCHYPAGKFVNGAANLVHELHHLNDAANGLASNDVCELEAHVYRAQMDFLCALLNCADNSASPISPEARDMINAAKPELCKQIKGLADWLCAECSESWAGCPACEGTWPGFTTIIDCSERQRDSNPGGSSGGDEANSFIGGSRRYGFFHMSSSADDIYANVTAEITQYDEVVRFAVSYSASGGFETLNRDLSTLATPMGYGTFIPVSIEAVTPREFYVAGYGEGNGSGMLLRLELTLDNLGASPGTISSTQIVYTGLAFTYPVAMAHRPGTPTVYISDRSTGDIFGFHMAAGIAFPVALSSTHPELVGRLRMNITEYWEASPHTPLGFKISTFIGGRVSRIPQSSVSGDHTFSLADTDRNGRLDRFWLH